MERDKSLSEQQELAQVAKAVHADGSVADAGRVQIEESIMALLAGNRDPKVLNGPDYPQLGYDDVLEDVA